MDGVVVDGVDAESADDLKATEVFPIQMCKRQDAYEKPEKI